MADAVAPRGPAVVPAGTGAPPGAARDLVRLYCARHRVTLVAALSAGVREARAVTAPEGWDPCACVLARNLPLTVLQDLAAAGPAPGRREAIRSVPAAGRG